MNGFLGEFFTYLGLTNKYREELTLEKGNFLLNQARDARDVAANMKYFDIDISANLKVLER